MTYCLGIRIKSGLVAIADTRLTSGTNTATGRKLYVYKKGQNSFFLMTSGLRSVRDKTITYFEEFVEEELSSKEKLYEAVNKFGEHLKQVRKEDKESIESSGLSFDLHTIFGGQFKNDKEHKMYLVYPEGNWIEITEGNPFIIIGNSGNGKPILKRTVTYNSSMKFVLKTGFLSFDSTRVSVNDVGYPIDVVTYKRDSFEFTERRYEENDLKHVSDFWAKELSDAIRKVPDDWTSELLPKKVENTVLGEG
jgi:putative proteasome-type protease